MTIAGLSCHAIAEKLTKMGIKTPRGKDVWSQTTVGTTLEYVASAFNGWQAVKIGSQVGWVSGEYSEITTE